VRVIGVDARRGGWVAVELSGGAFAAAHFWTELPEPPLAVEVIGIDMPVGLLDAGWRDADRQARQRLGRRASSVFGVPPRPAWEAEDYDEANRICRERTEGGGMSRQVFGLRKKLLAVDDYARDRPGLVYEVHPEVSFRTMTGTPMAHRKTTWAGQVERRRALGRCGVAIPDDLGPAGLAAPDDVLDAAAAAWTAHRIAVRSAGSLPNPPQRHGGREIAIWF
jgi:predicted RNase H-like nuclease